MRNVIRLDHKLYFLCFSTVKSQSLPPAARNNLNNEQKKGEQSQTGDKLTVTK